MNDDIPALATRDLTINFGGQVAVNAVTCAFHQGTLTAIVGPNGAGKTTYFNLISGTVAPSTAGSVSLFGNDITRLGAPDRTRLGLGRAFQLINLYPNLTVFENVRLAVQSVAQIRFDCFSIAARNTAVRDEARHWLDRVKLGPRAELPVAALSHGDQRKLEVAILLALKPRVLMFDEPTAGMSLDEIPVILDLIEEIKAETRQDRASGRAPHGCGQAARRPHHRAAGRNADRRRPAGRRGRVAGGAAGLSRRPRRRRIAARVGTMSDDRRASCCALEGVFTNIGRYRILHGVDLTVRRGRVTVLLGRNGAGKTTTLRTIMGLWKARPARSCSMANRSPRWKRRTSRAAASPTCRRTWASSAS